MWNVYRPPAALRESVARAKVIREGAVAPGYSTATARTNNRLRLTDICQRGWESLVTWAVPVISICILSSAGPVLVTVGVAWWQSSMDIVTVSGPLVTRHGLDLLELQAGLPIRLLLMQAILSPLLMSWAQVVVLKLFLQDVAAIRLRQMIRAWFALVLRAILHGALIVLPAVAINVPLRDGDNDLVKLGQKAFSPRGMLHVALLRTADQILSTQGAAMAEFVPLWRKTTGSWPESSADSYYDYDQKLASEYNVSSGAGVGRIKVPTRDSVSVRLWFVLACIAVFVTIETLLRLQPVAIVQAIATERPAMHGFFVGLRLGVRHFGSLASYCVSLRIAYGAFAFLFIVSPQVFRESVIVSSYIEPLLASTSLTQLQPAGFLLAWATLNAVWAAFCMACDTQLFRELSADRMEN